MFYNGCMIENFLNFNRNFRPKHQAFLPTSQKCVLSLQGDFCALSVSDTRLNHVETFCAEALIKRQNDLEKLHHPQKDGTIFCWNCLRGKQSRYHLLVDAEIDAEIDAERQSGGNKSNCNHFVPNRTN